MIASLAVLATLAAPIDDDPVARAAGFVFDTIDSPAWTEDAGALGNVGAKRRVTEAVLAYLLLLRPDLDPDGEWRLRLNGPVRSMVAGGAIAFENWMSGFATFYLLEEAFREEPDGRTLARLADGISDRQNREGGWGHGTSLGIRFYPSTLIVSTWMSTFALGGCRRHGVDVDPDVLDDALALLRDVQASSGGFPYGGRPYQKGVEAGRTSGVVAALASLGLTDDRLFEGAVGYMRRNVARIPEGHASPAVHVLSGALASAILGDDAWREYDDAVLSRVRRSQRDDGRFTDIVEGSPDSFTFMGGDALNTAYLTALYAAALESRRSRTVAAMRVDALPSDDLSANPWNPIASRWEASLPGVSGLALGRDVAVALSDDRELVRLDAATGEILGREPIDSPTGHATLSLAGDRLLLFQSPPDPTVDVPESMREMISADVHAARVSCFALAEGGLLWTSDAGAARTIRPARDGVLVVSPSGRLPLLSYEDGAALRDVVTPELLVNSSIATVDDGTVAVAAESRMIVKDVAGDVLWERKLRGPRGVNPPAFACLAATDDDGRLFIATTDGRVFVRDARTGELSWETSAPGAVSAIAAVGDERAVVLLADGTVRGLSPTGEAWRFDGTRGYEAADRPRLVRRGDRVWVATPASDRLTALDARTGAVEASLPLPRGRDWAATERSRGDRQRQRRRRLRRRVGVPVGRQSLLFCCLRTRRYGCTQLAKPGVERFWIQTQPRPENVIRSWSENRKLRTRRARVMRVVSDGSHATA